MLLYMAEKSTPENRRDQRRSDAQVLLTASKWCCTHRAELSLALALQSLPWAHSALGYTVM